MSLPPETRDHFTQVIDSILGQSDLTTISEKRIRRGLQDVVGYDLTPQKTAIKQLIMERFDIFADQGGIGTSADGTTSNAGTSNGHEDNTDSITPPEPESSKHSASPQKRRADSDELSELSNAKSLTKSPPPPKKKKLDNDLDADAVYAAKLQAEENMRARPTRGGNTRKAAPAKKKAKPKTKTSKKVKAEDDSDVESGSDGAKKEVNRSGGFHLSRPQTVKRLWQYIREHNLQDPSDRRQIRCDDAMRAVFKQERVHMFTMTKILNQNLYSPDE